MDDQEFAIYKRGSIMTAILCRALAAKLVLLAASLEVDGSNVDELGESFDDVSADINAYRASLQLLRRLWVR